MTLEEIGIVQAVNRYPVKSMGGEVLTAATLRWSGIDGDRQYAFVRAENRSRFPWLTGREVSELVTWSARYDEPDNPRQSKLRVVAGDGTAYDVNDPELRERLGRAAGEEVRLMQIGRGTFDSVPVSVVSTATLDLVEAQCGRPVDSRRFRINIVIATAAGVERRENHWLGGTLIFGDGPQVAKLRVNAPIDRCVMVTIDPDTAERDPKILRCVAQDFGNEIGAGCSPEVLGKISAGDRVRLRRSG